MTAYINGRALTNGEFVCVVNNTTYVGYVQNFTYTSASSTLSTCSLTGIITDRAEQTSPSRVSAAVPTAVPAAVPAARGRLTVQFLPANELPCVGDRDTLYIVSDDGILDEAAYVYRPFSRSPDPEPYKATDVSAAVVARLYDRGDQLPSHADVTRDSMAVPVRYVIAERSNAQSETRTSEVRASDNFLAWVPFEWRLNEIPVRSRPGHIVLPEVRDELLRRNGAAFDEVTRREVLLNGFGAREATAGVVPGPVVTYVSCLDELPVQGEEHRLYCIYGYEAAYVYRPDVLGTSYRPTNLSAAALAAHYPDGATLMRVPGDTRGCLVPVFLAATGNLRWCLPEDAQGPYACAGLFFSALHAVVHYEPLEGRRDNTADAAVYEHRLPAGTAIPNQTVQSDPVVVPIPRINSPRASVSSNNVLQSWVRANNVLNTVGASSWLPAPPPSASTPPAPPPPAQPKFDPLTAFDRQIPRRLLLDD